MNVGPLEIMVIMVVALLVFGPHRLPEVGRQVGGALRELRKMQDTVRGELDMVLHPEHGTATADAEIEAADHQALPSGDPIEPGDHERAWNNGSSAPDADRGFIGPPDSFT